MNTHHREILHTKELLEWHDEFILAYSYENIQSVWHVVLIKNLIYPLAYNSAVFIWVERIVMRIIFLANLILQYIEFLQNCDSIPALHTWTLTVLWKVTKKYLGKRHTSPWLLGIIVTLAIFLSNMSKMPDLSPDALTNVPELLPAKN